MTLVDRIKKVAKDKKGWNLKTTAEKAGIGINSIYRWKTQAPQSNKLQLVADVLGVTTDYLLNGDRADASNAPVDLDKALSEEGMAMFDGKPLSQEYKKALLAMLRANRNDGE